MSNTDRQTFDVFITEYSTYRVRVTATDSEAAETLAEDYLHEPHNAPTETAFSVEITQSGFEDGTTVQPAFINPNAQPNKE